MEELVLLMPNQSKPFQIESDTSKASKVATGAVLTQLDSNGDRHPIAFLSKTSLKPKESTKSMIENYLALFGHYSQECGHTTIVYSDHKNLTYF
jgi:RNase H-like domain found in reverse transcriptase